VKVVRAALVVVIVMNLALLAVHGPFRATILRYQLAQKQQELRRLAQENRVLLHQSAEARLPERVLARAAAFGIDLKTVTIEGDSALTAAGASPAKGRGAAPSPRP
jgi:DNA-binding transcriptional regulator YbjK